MENLFYDDDYSYNDNGRYNNEYYDNEDSKEKLLEKYLYDLIRLDNWVVYKLVPRENGKSGKIPINPHDNTFAKANDPNTWGSYDEAKEAVKKYNLYGIGFELGVEPSGYIAIDLDDAVRDGNETLKPWASNIINLLNSYTEYSPSGKGFHILCKTDKSMAQWDYEKISNRNDDLGVEMYDHKRFITITGNIYRNPLIMLRTEELKQVYQKYLHRDVPSVLVQSAPSLLVNGNVMPVMQTVLMSQEDKELWDKMFSSQNGQKISRLFNGDITEYNNDDSRADLALCNYLAYWTNKDVARIDRMFRQTKLMRAKWDQGNNPTYGERTINTALMSLPPAAPLSFQQPLNVPPAIPTSTYNLSVVTDEDMSVFDYLNNSFDEDVNKFRKVSGCKTGFANIDANTSLYPGLYLLGAVPGLGKTTFASQLADNLSRAGEHVLYFSLEQRVIELVSKGLSRLIYNRGGRLKSLQIREQGLSNELVVQAIEDYKMFSKNEHFLSVNFSNFDFIKNKVEKYVLQNKVRPVVIIGYLQIIQPSDNNKNTTKDVIDNHVRELKKLQVSHDLILIVISALNRANYMAPIDYESFKETGALEYTCDVVLGLQLQIMNDDTISGKKETVSEKREKIKIAKAQNPRKLELVCIKNRFGSNYSCYFDYNAAYDLFLPQQNLNNNQELNTVPLQTVARI